MDNKNALKRIRKYLEGDRDSPYLNESILVLYDAVTGFELNASEKALLKEALTREITFCEEVSAKLKDDRYVNFAKSLKDKLTVLM